MIKGETICMKKGETINYSINANNMKACLNFNSIKVKISNYF